MKSGEALGAWMAACDNLDRAGDQLNRALDGDITSRDYAARQLFKAAANALRAIYCIDAGLSPGEAEILGLALTKLSALKITIQQHPESTGERRGR